MCQLKNYEQDKIWIHGVEIWVKKRYIAKYGAAMNVTKSDLDGVHSIADHPKDIRKNSGASEITKQFMNRNWNQYSSNDSTDENV